MKCFILFFFRWKLLGELMTVLAIKWLETIVHHVPFILVQFQLPSSERMTKLLTL